MREHRGGELFVVTTMMHPKSGEHVYDSEAVALYYVLFYESPFALKIRLARE